MWPRVFELSVAISLNSIPISPFSGRSTSKTIDRMLEDYGAYEILDFIITQLSRHPFLAFGMSICVLSCALPFIIFMVFAIATVIMTFTGFVIIEGKLDNNQTSIRCWRSSENVQYNGMHLFSLTQAHWLHSHRHFCLDFLAPLFCFSYSLDSYCWPATLGWCKSMTSSTIRANGVQ